MTPSPAIPPVAKKPSAAGKAVWTAGLLLAVAGLLPLPALAADDSARQAPGASSLQAPHPKHASFGKEHVSAETIHVADWVVDSADNQGMPFMIVDKVNARVLVFDASGTLQGAAPALLGLARGDDSTPGIGERKLSTIRPEERTTPAGRFVASLARDIHGEEILWVDYDAAISLHRVVKGTSGERRAQRLNSSASTDNRISYGCINVPVKFYEKLVSPAFTGTNGVVYILPETRPAREVFGSYDVAPAEGG